MDNGPVRTQNVGAQAHEATSSQAASATAGEERRISRAVVAAYEAALEVASEVSVEGVLQRIVNLAREVVGARYGALGVADDSGRLIQFMVSGISPEEREAIGAVPVGRGLLGVLIRDRESLLVDRIADDPRASGFPDHHPPMTSLLGVPILLGAQSLGNLYLTDRIDGKPFTVEDLEAVEIMATHAANAIDRARLYRALEDSRRRAEQQRDDVHTILENLPVGVMLVSADGGGATLVNELAVDLLLGPLVPVGVMPEYGRDYHLTDGDGRVVPFPEAPSQRSLRGETMRSRQFVVVRADGSETPVLVQAAPLRDRSGRVEGGVVIYQDIARLREAEQLKDDFLSLVSHEFRTPLTAIQGGAQFLRREVEALAPDTRRALLDDVVTESDRLTQMLGNMLSLAAIKAGRLEAETEPVLLGPFAKRIAEQVAPSAPGHSWVVDIAPGLPAAEGDPALLEQVLRNLYENAVKYSPDGGEIRTTAVSDGATVSLRVRDHGVGIGLEHVGQVFERFRRPGADPTVRGMGLGLYLSRALVEAQGGTIAAASAGVGRGAEFTVTLPVARGWRDVAPGRED